MHTRTALLLLGVVLALGALVLWQTRREDAAGENAERGLVPGLERDAVLAVRYDSLERGFQMRLERGEEGLWRLTDPLVYPAEPSMVGQLLDGLTMLQAQAWEGDPAALGLRPPRVVLEVEQRAGEGSRARRVELGGLDVDRRHAFFRVDGELVRSPRMLEALLELPLPEWRQRALLPEVSARTVIELQRSGSAVHPGGTERDDMTLEALLDDGWRSSAPFVAALSPDAFGTLLTNLCALRAADFVDDAPGPLALYGLDPPDFRIEVATVRGERVALRFAQVAGSDRWLCVREGWPNVFNVALESALWLTAPAEVLVDLELARAVRERVEGLRLLADGRETIIERTGFDWLVSAHGGPDGDLPRQKADTQRVEDLLGRVERARVAEVLPGIEFPSDGVVAGVFLRMDGAEHGGEIGPPHASPRGTEGRLFRRVGDQLAGLVVPDVLEIARTDPRSLRSDELHRVAELDIVQARASAGWAGAQRTWARDDRGRWTPEGSSAEAVGFARLVDRLLTVRAARFLEPGEDPQGTQPVAVVLLALGGDARAAFVLSLVSGEAGDPEAAEVLYESGERRAIVDGRLYFELRALLDLP